ncbi:CLUMA_CG014610, isoform A [Clunio marinus]|uniref:CLUMA_CG014610, isoform A n=1 Tax=Clunio marinus TaxID=568069 RepID=A0A1J1IS29_9DIPT|nr:CLUMA_CG014610, isoform A [Clunio marinus]
MSSYSFTPLSFKEETEKINLKTSDDYNTSLPKGRQEELLMSNECLLHIVASDLVYANLFVSSHSLVCLLHGLRCY